MPETLEINQVGRREDLSDILVVADAKNTPVTSMMPKGKKPIKTHFEWVHMAIPAPDTTAIADGAPADNVEDLSGNRGILEGRIQKLRRTIGVSELAEDVSTPAGITSEFANAKSNGLLAVKRAIEAVFCGDQDSSLVGTTNTCRGLGKWISATAQSDLPVPSQFLTPSASIWTDSTANLTEDIIRGIMQSIYKQTGQMLDLDGVVGVALKTAISKMTVYEPNVSSNTRVRTFFTKLEEDTLYAKVDIIKGDFGEIRILPTLWNNWNNSTKAADDNRGYLLNIKGIKMRANKLPGFKPLPEDDSGPKGVITAIVSQQLDSPLVHGKLVGS